MSQSPILPKPSTNVIIQTTPTNTPTKTRRRRNRKKKQQKPKPQRKAVASASATSPAMRAWIMSLNDPFEHQGPRIGFGTLQPSNQCTAYLKQTLTCNADGSLAFYLMPFVGSTTPAMAYNNNGAAVVGWTNVSFSNAAIISSQGLEGRVISCALRVLPLIAATSVPGILTAGAVPTGTQATLAGLSPNSMAALPYGVVGLASSGAVVSARPQDDASFTFTNNVILGSTGTLVTWSVPYFVLTGAPASASVFVEAVLNVETIGGLNSVNLIDGEQINSPDTLAGGMYATAEQAFRFATKHINPSAVMSAAHEFASSGNAYNALDAGLRAMSNHKAATRTHPRNTFLIEDLD